MTDANKGIDMPDTKHHAHEYASDAVPPKRDENGFALFYRQDLVEAYLKGAGMEKSYRAPLVLVERVPTNMAEAAHAFWMDYHWKDSLPKTTLVREAAHKGFLAGWLAHSKLDASPVKTDTPKSNDAYLSVMLGSIENRLMEMQSRNVAPLPSSRSMIDAFAKLDGTLARIEADTKALLRRSAVEQAKETLRGSIEPQQPGPRGNDALRPLSKAFVRPPETEIPFSPPVNGRDWRELDKAMQSDAVADARRLREIRKGKVHPEAVYVDASHKKIRDLGPDNGVHRISVQSVMDESGTSCMEVGGVAGEGEV